MRLSDIEENAQVLLLFIDLPYHKFKEISIVGNILLLLEVIGRRNESFLVDFQKEINQVLISLECLHQKFKKWKDCLKELWGICELFYFLAEELHKFVLDEVTMIEGGVLGEELLVEVGHQDHTVVFDWRWELCYVLGSFNNFVEVIQSCFSLCHLLVSIIFAWIFLWQHLLWLDPCYHLIITFYLLFNILHNHYNPFLQTSYQSNSQSIR